MRAWLCVAAAALALALSPTAAAEPESARLDHIKRQILAKLGLSNRPQPVRAPPRDVVRQILARAADPEPPPEHNQHINTREIIAIADREAATRNQNNVTNEHTHRQLLGYNPKQKIRSLASEEDYWTDASARLRKNVPYNVKPERDESDE